MDRCEGKVIKLLNKGIGKYWETRHDSGKGRAVFYCPIVQPSIYKDNETIRKGQSETDRTEGHENTTKTVDNSALSYCPDNIQTIRTENNLEDSEAFKEYLNHYTQKGLPLSKAKHLAKMDYEADYGKWET